jgi:UDPglucose 6-dehydrogenase
MINHGNSPIYEPGLEPLLRRNLAHGTLSVTTDAKTAIDFAELIFIAVGTPTASDGTTDISQVISVAETIGKNISEPKIVVNKSTSPVGTTDRIREIITAKIKQRRLTIKFDVCSNPEFMKEGSAIEDFTRAARIVVGCESDHAKEALRRCYAPYNRRQEKFLFMDPRSAELTKYAANAMLATRISFMNEIAYLAEHLNADIELVRQGLGSDPRIGYDFLYAGCGYGGSCFPKDIQAITVMASSFGLEAYMAKATAQVNARQKRWAFERLKFIFKGELKGKTIALWGLAFKPNTDDMREAPSRILMEQLWEAGSHVNAFDPIAMHKTQELYPEETRLTLFETQEEALIGANALVICTEWKQFRAIDFTKIKTLLSNPIIIDGRNIYDPSEAEKAGFIYFGVGRSSIKS